MNSVPVRRANDSCICTAGHTTCSWPIPWRKGAGVQYFVPGRRLPVHNSGLFSGCGLVRGFRQFTLECWFNRSCFQQVLTTVRYSAVPRTMNASIPSRFCPARTATGDIVDELSIESWQNVSNYTSYFDACAPLTCEYVEEGRVNGAQLLSLLLGPYGGVASCKSRTLDSCEMPKCRSCPRLCLMLTHLLIQFYCSAKKRLSQLLSLCGLYQSN